VLSWTAVGVEPEVVAIKTWNGGGGGFRVSVVYSQTEEVEG